MRFLSAGAFALALTATPVFALNSADTMKDWAGASSTDKDALLRELDGVTGGDSARASVRSCLDDTSKAAGHSDLPISQVAKACSDQAARDAI